MQAPLEPGIIVEQLLSGLPASLPCHPDFETYRVPQDDRRVGLRGELGVRLKPDAKRAVRKGTLLGPYQARASLAWPASHLI
jgi:hypothetical protein